MLTTKRSRTTLAISLWTCLAGLAAAQTEAPLGSPDRLQAISPEPTMEERIAAHEGGAMLVAPAPSIILAAAAEPLLDPLPGEQDAPQTIIDCRPGYKLAAGAELTVLRPYVGDISSAGLSLPSQNLNLLQSFPDNRLALAPRFWLAYSNGDLVLAHGSGDSTIRWRPNRSTCRLAASRFFRPVPPSGWPET